MSSRFEHLKKKRQSSEVSLEEFIEGADVEDRSTQAKIKPNKKNILLSVSGRINREKNCGKPILVYLKKELEMSMKKYCHGNKTLVINYLIERGINVLLEEDKLVLHMEEDENT